MSNFIRRLLPTFLFCTVAVSLVVAQTTTFNFQGSLENGGSPANGNYDFEFALFDSLNAGTQLGSTLTRTNVSVGNGIFTVSLDFGNVFGGAGNRYLEVRARNSGGGSYTTLAPRTSLTASPYSIRALQADNAVNLNSQPSSFYLNASNLSAGTLSDGRLSANIPRLNAGNSFVGGLQIDTGDANNGTVGMNTLRFGGGATGEGIGSRRIAGTNQWGLDLYTNSTPRVSILNNGNIGVGTQTPTATLDVNGTLNASNYPAYKGTQTLRDPRNLNSALVIAAGTFADLNNISVDVPAAGTLLITATANIYSGEQSVNTDLTSAWFKLEETTSGSPVQLVEVGNFNSLQSGVNVSIENGSTMTISWTLPSVTAGTRSFKTAMTMSANSGNFSAKVFTTTLNVLYIGKSL